MVSVFKGASRDCLEETNSCILVRGSCLILRILAIAISTRLAVPAGPPTRTARASDTGPITVLLLHWQTFLCTASTSAACGSLSYTHRQSCTFIPHRIVLTSRTPSTGVWLYYFKVYYGVYLCF